MQKKGFIGFRLEGDNLEFVKEQSKKSNRTMSDWIRNEIIILKGNKK